MATLIRQLFKLNSEVWKKIAQLCSFLSTPGNNVLPPRNGGLEEFWFNKMDKVSSAKKSHFH